MAKKRGRPPKTPTSTSKNKDSDTKPPADVEGLELDVEDLSKIDNLSPKKALAWIEKLDDLRSKIKERVALDDNTVLSLGKDGNINNNIDIVKDLEAPEPDQNQTKNKDSADLINGNPKQTFEKAPSQAKKDLVNQYNGVRTAAELFLRQKAKLLWLKDGDANTKIFHQSIKKRLYHNRVLNITKDDGSTISDPILIHKEFQCFYEKLFKKQ
ncbi:hypothetical protein RIF29_09565 [Crotalaria pallida]|uniref:Uncharacterized protein n=1 Tax=Crotalaria pallida TaxID=3830 RepID=A0AAN9FS07_CROPI